ncbi:MAG TPA: glycosyltransferase family 9 protein, partial [Verrucomicrobiae bacterium]|nr:glycosyltransferase family 9 protein [Verrucomicrobiae bacterium]
WQLTKKLRYSRFDWVLDLQGLFRSGWFTALTGAELRAGFADARELAAMFYNHRVSIGPIHTVDRNIALLRSLGIEAQSEDMQLEISPVGKSYAENFCKKAPSRQGNFLVTVPPTTWETKLYPVRHWRKVISALSERTEVVLVGSPSETALCNEIAEGMKKNVLNLSGKTTVDELVGLISVSSGVICCDSAAKFIAPAVGVDCVTLIGPTQTQRTGPYLKGEALIGEVPCQGCLKRRCPHVTCMQMIDPDDVVRAAEKMLSKGLDT